MIKAGMTHIITIGSTYTISGWQLTQAKLHKQVLMECSTCILTKAFPCEVPVDQSIGFAKHTTRQHCVLCGRDRFDNSGEMHQMLALCVSLVWTSGSTITWMKAGPPVIAPSLPVVTTIMMPFLSASALSGYHLARILSPNAKPSVSNSSFLTVTTSSLYPVSVCTRRPAAQYAVGHW